MVGTQLVASSPSTIRQQRFKLGSGGSVVVDKRDEVYQLMSATAYWRLGQDTYDLCVEHAASTTRRGPWRLRAPAPT